MTVTIERPTDPSAWIPVAEATTAVTAVVASPQGQNQTVPRMIDWIAKDIQPGVWLSNRHTENGVDELREPLKVVAIEDGVDCTGDPILWFTIDNGWRLPFEHDFVCEVQCIPLPCPPWCVKDEFDTFDGTVRHVGAEDVLSFRDEAGKDRECYVVLSRWDDPDGTISEDTSVSIVFEDSNGFDMMPGTAAELGAIIARAGAAGIAGPNFVEVEDIRLGDSVETPAGWQTVTGLMHDALCAEVAIYTVSDDEAALRVPLGTPVNHFRNGRGRS